MIDVNCFVAKNITKFNNDDFCKRSFCYSLYSIFFKIKPKEKVSFFFCDAKEKEVFINILSGKDVDYSGFFEYKDKIFFSNSKNNISEIIDFNDVNYFLSQQLQFKSLSFFQNKNLFKVFFDKNNHLVKKHNDNINFYKNLFLYNFKKNELESNRTLYNQIEEVLKSINIHIDKIKTEDSYASKLNLFDDIYYIYESYLKNRISLLYFRNQKLIQYFLKKIENNKKNNKNSSFYLKKSNFFKLWNDFLDVSKFRWSDYLKKVKIAKNIKHKNLIKLKTKQNEFILFQQKYKKHLLISNLSDRQKFKYAYKYSVNKFCTQFIKKNIESFYYLDNEQMEQLISEIRLQSSLLLVDIDFFQKDNNLKFNFLRKHFTEIQRKLNANFKIDVNYYQTFSENNYKNIFIKETKYKTKTFRFKEKTNSIANQKLTEIEKQNFHDELKWLETNFISLLNEELNKLNNDVKIQLEQHNYLKKEFQQKVTELLSLFDEIIKEIKFKKQDSLLNQHKNLLKHTNFFDYLNNSYLKMHKNLQNDFKQMNVFLNKKIKLIQRKKYLLFLYKYHIYEISNLCDLDFFDLYKNVAELPNFKKVLLLIIKFLLSDKPVSVININFNLFSNEEKQNFLNIYKNIVDSTSKFWIQLSDNFKDLKMQSDWLNVIKNAKNIEFGKINELSTQPFYDYTCQLLNHSNIKNICKHMLVESENITYKNDFYKLDNNHYIYGDLKEIYNKVKKIPHKSSLTFMPFKIEEFKSNVSFITENSRNKKTKKIDDFTNQQESIIIDVTV